MPEGLQRYSVDFVEAGLAAKALSGAPILVFPYGTHYREDWWGDSYAFEVDEALVDEALDNFANRTKRGLRQKWIPVNVEHDSRNGARGWYTDLVKLPEGLGATFRWNAKGKQALQDEEFAYFSLEFAWDMLDRVTGRSVRNQVVGGALTNSPYFGEETALHNQQNGGKAMPGAMDLSGLKAQLAALFKRVEAGDDVDGLTVVAATGAEEHADFSAEIAAQVAALRADFSAQVGALQAERDGALARVAELQAAVSTVNDQREREHFARLAETLPYLPRDAQFAEHLQWLHAAAQGDAGAAHLAYFMEVLRKANTEFAQAHRLTSLSAPASGSAEEQLAAFARAYQEQHGGAYGDALRVAMASHPELERVFLSETHV